jgi:hypothetical protein
LYGCKTGSLTLGGEDIVFNNRVLRRIFEPKSEEVTGCWIKMHNVEFHNLYFSPNIKMIISRRMIWLGHLARVRAMIIPFWWKKT